MYGRKQGIKRKSVTSAQFCSEPKMDLKNCLFFKKSHPTTYRYTSKFKGLYYMVAINSTHGTVEATNQNGYLYKAGACGGGMVRKDLIEEMMPELSVHR